ncbi:MAG: hypothetical protein IKZ87_02665, partial [Actinomycetaceae bacterium]|nr:hypothetical protein [Actinomycetaceae bacterium]
AIGVSLFFSILDYANIATRRSHLGRFIQSVKDGHLMSVLSRKIAAAAFGLPVPIAIAVVVVLILVCVWGWKKYASKWETLRRFTSPFDYQEGPKTTETANSEFASVMRYSVPAVLLTLISAAFINDSSLTIPVVGGAMALMLYSAAVLRTR